MPAIPTAPAEQWLLPARNETNRELRLRRELFARWLRPSPDDPFPLLADFTSMTERSASAGSLLLLSRLSEREGYPAPPHGPKGGQFHLEKSGDSWSGVAVTAWIA